MKLTINLTKKELLALRSLSELKNQTIEQIVYELLREGLAVESSVQEAIKEAQI